MLTGGHKVGFHYGGKDDHLKHLPKKDFGKYSLHNQLDNTQLLGPELTRDIPFQIPTPAAAPPRHTHKISQICHLQKS